MARTWTILASQIERMDAFRDDLAPYWAKEAVGDATLNLLSALQL